MQQSVPQRHGILLMHIEHIIVTENSTKVVLGQYIGRFS